MKGFTKKLVMMMALVFALGFAFGVNADNIEAKAKKPSMPKSTSVTVSKTKTIVIKNIKKAKIRKTTWSVGNKKLLKLVKKAKNTVKVKGLKAGKTKVKAVIRMKNRKLIRISATVKINAKKPAKKPVTPPVVKPTPKPVVTPKPTPAPTPMPPVTHEEEMVKMETLPSPATYEKTLTPPDLLTTLSGDQVTTKLEWEARRREIRCILQRYMYGIWRDGSEETVSYTVDGSSINIKISKGDKEASFSASFTKPSGTAPEGGWPVIVAVGGVSNSYIAQKGYATISFSPNTIASDNTSRTGAFYTLYPYSSTDWREQTGSVLAWGWGASKILDALEVGAGTELGISSVNTIVTGVSRYGKAAAAAGAFEDRFKVSMPVCSGYGGLTMMRYSSNNLTFNLLPEFENDPKKDDVSDLSQWTANGGTEPIQSLQGSGWFCDSFKEFKTYQNEPFDANYIAALTAMEGRYLFMVTGINSDMYNSPAGLWWNYNMVKPAYDLIGCSDNLAIQMHLNLHGIETVDLCKLFAFTDLHFYQKTTDPATFPSPWNDLLQNFTLADLKSCIFASQENQASYLAGMPVDTSLLPPNPDITAPVNIMFGASQAAISVTRNTGGDALIMPFTGDSEGTGFKFQYGPGMQYGASFARFKITLPEGKTLSDYSSISFKCQTDGNYYGKRMSFIINPATTGLPSEVDYDYESRVYNNCISLTDDMDFPNNTATERQLTMDINETVAAANTGNEFDCSIYIHMENDDGKVWYSIKDIVFNEK